MRGIFPCVVRLLFAMLCRHHARQLMHGDKLVLDNLYTFVRSSDQQSVAALADRFDSGECQQAIHAANFDAWRKIVWPANHERMEFGNRIKTNPNMKVAYVRNYKVASTYMWTHLQELFGDENWHEVWQDYKSSHRDIGTAPVSTWHRVNKDWFQFTFVADPIQTALGAYIEVSLKSDTYDEQNETLAPSYRSISCGSRASRTSRFKKYLRSIRMQEKLGNQAFHSFPQALKINVDMDVSRRNSFDAIGKLESFQIDVRRIQELALEKLGGELPFSSQHLPAAPAELSRDRPHGFKNTESECADVDMEDPELIHMLCEMYRVDYICFDFALPSACQ